MARSRKHKLEYTAAGNGEVTEEKLRHDTFPTDVRIVRAALAALELPFNCEAPLRVLDAGAGDTCVWGLCFRELFPNAIISGIDIRDLLVPDGVDHWHCGDFLQHTGEYDVIIGNIPFSLAEAFIPHALSLLAPNGKVVFLLRVQFNGGQDRFRSFWTRWKLEREYYCASRMPFIKKFDEKRREFVPASDVWDYALFQFSNEWRHDWWITSRWDYKTDPDLDTQPSLIEFLERT